jgi:hypothetical protein
MKATFLKLVLVLAVFAALAWTPGSAQAQSMGTSQQTVVFPVYYRGYYPTYGWNPYWGYPYAVYPTYYYGMPPAYTYYWTPGYTLTPVQQGAYNYWARTTYVPYYRYYSTYRPAYYIYGY